MIEQHLPSGAQAWGRGARAPGVVVPANLDRIKLRPANLFSDSLVVVTNEEVFVATFVHGEQVVYHRLIRELVKQRRQRVEAAVDNE